VSRKEDSPYTDKVCKECGGDLWDLDFESVTTKKTLAVCKKCGARVEVKPGDKLRMKDHG
jgi:DNA-directed RNA polymerase subunit RPC12/RpoP